MANNFLTLDSQFVENATAHPEWKSQFGGKGYNLIVMKQLGLNVPPAFIIPTAKSLTSQKTVKDGTTDAQKIRTQVGKIGKDVGRVFGDTDNPLLLSVRSGAPVSMPGMMDTILNVGITDATVNGLAALTNEDFAWDSYVRLAAMYATTVKGVSAADEIDPIIESWREFAKIPVGQLPAEISREIISTLKKKLKDDFVPQDVWTQLFNCVGAVWKSWWGERAQTYRNAEGIADSIGTAVVVQVMVFGNLNDKSGTGVAFTRNPNTGENVRYGDFLVNAQGEDVVSGSFVTLPLSDLAVRFPKVNAELEASMIAIENHYKGDLCDIEFTIEDGTLWMLQTRIGKRATDADVRITLDRLADGHIDTDTAAAILRKMIAKVRDSAGGSMSTDSEMRHVATGVGAVPGIVVGRAAFSSADAVRSAEVGEQVILIRKLTSPDDVAGMKASVGILTATGGLVSHAAVVARGWDKPCVVGCEQLHVQDTSARIGDVKIEAGDLVKIDGTTGNVYVV